MHIPKECGNGISGKEDGVRGDVSKSYFVTSFEKGNIIHTHTTAMYRGLNELERRSSVHSNEIKTFSI